MSHRKKSHRTKGGWPRKSRAQGVGGAGRELSRSCLAWASWPEGEAYSSYLGALRICGQGLTAYSRRGPDGRAAFCVGLINVFRGGLEGIICDEGSEDTFRRELIGEAATKGGYLMEPAPPELAATLLWGIYEFGLQVGFSLPDRDLERVKSLVPCPHGGPSGCLAALTRPGGIIAPELLRIARSFGTDVELPEGQEQVVFTTVRFRVPDISALLAWMRGREPEFSDEGEDEEGIHFGWTRAYPKGHWSPFAGQPGARQSLGHIVVCGQEIYIETQTSSRAAVFAQLLHQKFPENLSIIQVEWKSWRDVLDRL